MFKSIGRRSVIGAALALAATSLMGNAYAQDITLRGASLFDKRPCLYERR